MNENLKYYVRIDCSDNNIGNEGAIIMASVFAQKEYVCHLFFF